MVEILTEMMEATVEVATMQNSMMIELLAHSAAGNLTIMLLNDTSLTVKRKPKIPHSRMAHQEEAQREEDDLIAYRITFMKKC